MSPDLKSPIPIGPIVCLVFRIRSDDRDALNRFLQSAVPVYERPGGITIGLYESIDEPGLLLELVAYDSESAYEADQQRIEQDAEMRQLLEKWHGFIEGPLEVRKMRPISIGSSSD